MKEYHKLENELFARWEAKWNSEDPKIQKLHRLEGGDYCKCRKVVRDGMMYRGRIIFYPDGECERQSGDEYKRWEKAPLRLIMLTKDHIDDWDKRSETACDTQEQYDNWTPAYPGFYENYIRWIYCMLTPEMKEGRWTVKTFDEANDFSLSMKYMIHEAPLVRMNVKKQEGDKKGIPPYILKWFIDAYEDEIVDQIRIYNANILFCCEKKGHIKNLIKRRILPDLKDVNDYMFYSSSERVLVVNFFHPSCWKNDEDLYIILQEAYKDFLQQYPGFPMGI